MDVLQHLIMNDEPENCKARTKFHVHSKLIIPKNLTFFPLS